MATQDQTPLAIGESKFEGGLLGLIGMQILSTLLTAVTLGIAYPWAMCMMYSWETKNTVIQGRRLKFTGTAAGLFGLYIKWLLLCVITFGIYGFWMGISLKKWKIKHTVFVD